MDITRTGPQQKALNKFQKKIEGTLTTTDFKKLSVHDKEEYIKQTLIKKRGNRNRTYGYYSCYHCAKADIFNEGYISED